MITGKTKILADSSIWIDHFHKKNTQLQYHLKKRQILMHPYVMGELACGSLKDRDLFLDYLSNFRRVKFAPFEDTMNFIETHKLYSKGVGLTDFMLLASTLITPNTLLWTNDKRLAQIANSLNILHTPN